MRHWGTSSVLLISILAGCGTREDYSTPKSAARTFYVALTSGDDVVAGQALMDAAQRQVLGDVKALIEQLLAAQEATQARFGSDPSGSGGLPSLADIESAAEQIQGDSAMLIPVNPSILRIQLRKVEGNWKLDLFSTFSLGNRDPQGARAIVQSACRSVASHLDRLRAGQYKSAREADEALQRTITMAAVIGSLQRG